MLTRSEGVRRGHMLTRREGVRKGHMLTRREGERRGRMLTRSQAVDFCKKGSHVGKKRELEGVTC